MMRNRKHPLLWWTSVLIVAVVLGAVTWNVLAGIRPLPPPTSTVSATVNAPALDESLAALFDGAPLTVERTVWTAELPELLAAPPLVVADYVYVVAGETSATGRVLALDVATGQVVWERPLDSIADHAPVAAGDWLYIATRGGVLLALDRHSGEEQWVFQGRFGLSGPPVVQEGVLYVGSEAVFNLDAATGAIRWQRELAGRIVQPLAFANDIVAAIDADHVVHLLNARNGRTRLSFPLWFNPLDGPTIVDETVAIAGDQAHVQALDLHARDVPLAKTVRFFWTRLWLYGGAPQPPPPRGYAWQARDIDGINGYIAAADAERFYLSVEDAGQTGRVLALDSETGTVQWETSFAAPVAQSAMLLGNVLVTGTANGALVGIDATSGRVLWKVLLAEPVLAAPAVVGNRLVVPVGDGSLRAVEVSAGTNS